MENYSAATIPGERSEPLASEAHVACIALARRTVGSGVQPSVGSRSKAPAGGLWPSPRKIFRQIGAFGAIFAIESIGKVGKYNDIRQRSQRVKYSKFNNFIVICSTHYTVMRV